MIIVTHYRSLIKPKIRTHQDVHNQSKKNKTMGYKNTYQEIKSANRNGRLENSFQLGLFRRLRTSMSVMVPVTVTTGVIG